MNEPARTWLNRHTARLEMERHVTRAVLAGTNTPTPTQNDRHIIPSPGELRGIPAVGRDTGGGHIRGTHPEQKVTR